GEVWSAGAKLPLCNLCQADVLHNTYGATQPEETTNVEGTDPELEAPGTFWGGSGYRMKRQIL
ncbi:MAG: hypothetical protein WCT05_05320, partial [Lentisphaeria bacterium]